MNQGKLSWSVRMTDPRMIHQDPDKAVKVATYLWQEYQYRHDLVWQLVFRVTAVATLLLIAPLLANQSVRDIVDGWLVALPVIAILVIVIAFFVLQRELQLLKKIKDAYREAQNQALVHHPHWTLHEFPSDEPDNEPNPFKKLRKIPGRLDFEHRVSLFLLLILLAAVLFLFLFLVFWLPEMGTKI
jgi:hypothetical protein